MQEGYSTGTFNAVRARQSCICLLLGIFISFHALLFFLFKSLHLFTSHLKRRLAIHFFFLFIFIAMNFCKSVYRCCTTVSAKVSDMEAFFFFILTLFCVCICIEYCRRVYIGYKVFTSMITIIVHKTIKGLER